MRGDGYYMFQLITKGKTQTFKEVLQEDGLRGWELRIELKNIPDCRLQKSTR